MTRHKPPNRLQAITMPFIHKNFMGSEIKSFLTYGFDNELIIRTIFCADPRIGSDVQAVLTDLGILVSLNLQSGATIEGLRKSMSENRPEGKKSGPPASLAGSMLQAALEMQQYLTNKGTEGLTDVDVGYSGHK